MKKLFIESISQLIEFDRQIKTIVLEDNKLYQELSVNIEKNIVYSLDDKVEKIEKKVLFIYNPFQLNINETKLVKALYKRLEAVIKLKLIEKLSIIEQNVFTFIEELSNDENVCLNFEEDVDIQKMFASFGLCYKVSDNYLENLINYIKIYKDVFENTLIISYGLLNLLNNEEIKLLENELTYLDIHLIDIRFVKKPEINDLIIDKDWCII